MMFDDALAYRRKYRGLLGIQPKLPIRDTATLSVVYTPGVARPCIEIDKDPEKSFEYTIRRNTVAVISDGSSVYNLGNIGPYAALPMLEAKCVFHKTFAGIDAFPIALDTQDIDEMVETIRYLSPTFGAIHIEDISSPRCFTLEERLKRAISLPIFHSDQQGAAVMVYAALINSLKLVDKKLSNIRIVVNGSGAAGIATARFLKRVGAGDVKIVDSKGVVAYRRLTGMNWIKSEIARETNEEGFQGSLAEIIKGADVFIGFSAGNILTAEMVQSMAKDPIVFGLANPHPEIDYHIAKAAGAKIVATGRSDFPNQLNSSIIAPGIFRGALDASATEINHEMFVGAAVAMADLVWENELSPDCVVPKALDLRISAKVARAVSEQAQLTGVSCRTISPEAVEERVMAYVYEGTNAWVEHPSKMEYESLEEESLDLHQRYHGVIETKTKIPIRDHFIYNLIYSSPGASIPCEAVRDNPDEAYEITVKNNLVGIVTDGSAVLGLGNLGPAAAMPVMEGKAVLFKTFGGVEAFPICLRTQEVDEIVKAVIRIAPVFGGINLEDIAAPRCFEIEEKLSAALDIPIFHDDQHGTAVVVLAGFINALKVIDKKIEQVSVVINGAGAASLSVAQLLMKAGVTKITICDTKGAIYAGRPEGMNKYKDLMAAITNLDKKSGSLADVMQGSDIFIGLSAPNMVSPEMVQSMAPNPAIFALANPTPEIMPDAAYAAGAKVVATGRSDFPNQVNNSLAFPGIFRGALDIRAKTINIEMKLAAAYAIAGMLSPQEIADNVIIPGAFDFRVPPAVAEAVARAGIETGVARKPVDPKLVHAELKQYLYEGELKKIPHAPMLPC
jgi:malate dehydrogenase (oxaloacetate-decarboxylating)